MPGFIPQDMQIVILACLFGLSAASSIFLLYRSTALGRRGPYWRVALIGWALLALVAIGLLIQLLAVADDTATAPSVSGLVQDIIARTLKAINVPTSDTLTALATTITISARNIP